LALAKRNNNLIKQEESADNVKAQPKLVCAPNSRQQAMCPGQFHFSLRTT